METLEKSLDSGNSSRKLQNNDIFSEEITDSEISKVTSIKNIKIDLDSLGEEHVNSCKLMSQEFDIMQDMDEAYYNSEEKYKQKEDHSIVKQEVAAVSESKKMKLQLVQSHNINNFYDTIDNELKNKKQEESSPRSNNFVDQSTQTLEDFHPALCDCDNEKIAYDIANTDHDLFDDLPVKGKYRIIDQKYFLKSFVNLYKSHILSKCEKTNFKATKYRDEGLGSAIFFQCKNCSFERWITSEQREKRKMPINQLAVLANLVTGGSYEGCDQFFSGMNIPFMCEDTYISERRILTTFAEQALKDEIQKAGEVEKTLALENGQFIERETISPENVRETQKIPWIEVEGDGGYGKRSYRTGRYDSQCGVGVLIGVRTKKLLSLEVRNKFCWIDYMAGLKGVQPKVHRCFKNWSSLKSSSSMETDCILTGFQNSLETHGLIYKTFIADGDCSTYNALIKKSPYAHYQVRIKKKYCINHTLRNFCNKIVEISKMKIFRLNTRGSVGSFRKFMKKAAFRMRRTVIFHVDQRRKQTNLDEEKLINELQRDIQNLVNHTFGVHTNCKNRGLQECSKKKKVKNWIPILRQCKMLDPINRAVSDLSTHASSMIKKVTTNASESFMSHHAKVTGGKRVFKGSTDCYYTICNLAGIQYQTGKVLSIMARYIRQDLSVAEEREERILSKVKKNRDRKEKMKGQKRKAVFKYCNDEENYGENHKEPDVTGDRYDLLVEDHFKKLRENQKNRENIERETIQQSSNDDWYDLRRNLLTASKFGRICKMKDSTPRKGIINDILYAPPVDNAATSYGLRMEKFAKEKLEKELKVKVDPAGLCIINDVDKPYFAASLDGKIGNDGAVEYKSPYSAKDCTPLQAIKSIPRIRNIFDKIDSNKLNTNHDFYYQIQGQMHITGRQYCIFVLYTPKGIKWVRVEYDKKFWDEKMEPKLSKFYMDSLLPEIVNPRIHRNMDIREPTYVIEAQQKLEEKKLKKGQTGVEKSKQKKLANLKSSDSKKIDLTVAENEDLDFAEQNAPVIEPETALSRTKKFFAKKYFKELPVKSKGTGELKSAKVRLWKKLIGYLPRHLQLQIITKTSENTNKLVNKSSNKNELVIKSTHKNKLVNKTDIECEIVAEWTDSNINERSVRSIKKEFDERTIDVDSLKDNILPLESWINADAIDAFMRIQMNRGTNLVSQSVLYLTRINSKLIESITAPSVQIIGGNYSSHWRVLFFDGKTIVLYDSLYESINNKLLLQESEYLKLRFPQIKEEDIRYKKMLTKQCDTYSCGVFSAAYVESIISGKDPSDINYSTNMTIMRQHFFNIIRCGWSSPFPHHPKYEDVPGVDFGDDNEEDQLVITNAVNSDLDKDLIIISALQENVYVYDEGIQAFIQILQECAPDFEIHEIQHFHYRKLLRPPRKEKHLQIIGGVTSNHWMCLYYNGELLYIFDSLTEGVIENYGEQEKRYIQKRYPSIDFNTIKIVPVTRQPDSFSCGIYAAAFATEIAMGSNPAMKKFSKLPMKMRKHFAEIIRSGILVPFPEQKDDNKMEEMYPLIANTYL